MRAKMFSALLVLYSCTYVNGRNCKFERNSWQIRIEVVCGGSPKTDSASDPIYARLLDYDGSPRAPFGEPMGPEAVAHEHYDKTIYATVCSYHNDVRDCPGYNSIKRPFLELTHRCNGTCVVNRIRLPNKIQQLAVAQPSEDFCVRSEYGIHHEHMVIEVRTLQPAKKIDLLDSPEEITEFNATRIHAISGIGNIKMATFDETIFGESYWKDDQRVALSDRC